MANEEQNMKVAVRVRPCNRTELELDENAKSNLLQVLDSTKLLFDPAEEDEEFFFHGVKQKYRDFSKRSKKEISMEFDRVFDTNTKNEEIFQESAAMLVDSVLNGYNCCMFAYGATGTGKTFTMLGNRTCPGLISLTMNHLFNKIKQPTNNGYTYDLRVNYLEVYNEKVINLLTKDGPLNLREDANGVVVCGLNLTPAKNTKDLLELLAIGNCNRTQHPTDVNNESSRSHAIFQYATRVKQIRTNLRQNVMISNITEEFYVKKVNELTEENERLKRANTALKLNELTEENERLKRANTALTEENQRLKRANTALKLEVSKCSNLDENDYHQWCHRIDTLSTELAKAQEKQISLKSRIKVSELREKLKTDELMITINDDDENEAIGYEKSTEQSMIDDESDDMDRLEGEIIDDEYKLESNGEQCKVNDTKILSRQGSDITLNSRTFVTIRSNDDKENKFKCKSNLVTYVLSNKLVKISKNTGKLKNILLRSNKFGQRNLSATVEATDVQKEKEGGKIPTNQAQKSTNSTEDKYSVLDPNMENCQSLRSQNRINNSFRVRLNRAWMLRLKK
uniref:Kinesin motor domain-containing protein n=1 Tax=Glossina brevipalpis TaxID=37001 RepID=A0A1A9WQ44_9MUSC